MGVIFFSIRTAPETVYVVFQVYMCFGGLFSNSSSIEKADPVGWCKSISRRGIVI